jgi:hypothetical protein
MVKGSASADLRRVAKRIEQQPARIQQAADLAVASAARHGRALFGRSIRELAPLPARYVGGKLYRRPVDAGAWEIGAPRQVGVPGVVYPHRRIPGGRRGKGWRVQAHPGAWTDYPTAFAMTKPRTMTKYGPLIFRRVGSQRLPISVLTELSVSDLFAEVQDAVGAQIEIYLGAELARQIKRLEQA